MNAFKYVIIFLSSWLSFPSLVSGDSEMELLQNAIDALWNGLQFMEDNSYQINLDGAFGCRMVEEVFDAFLCFNTEVYNDLEDDLRATIEKLMKKAESVVETARKFLRKRDSKYYSVLGNMLDKGVVPLWRPSRMTDPSLQVEPIPCKEYLYKGPKGDRCLEGVIKMEYNRNVSESCLHMMTKPRMRGYALTHQVVYFILAELHGAWEESERQQYITDLMQDTLCSNMMREAQEIADADYPLNQQDLFLEHVGFCGTWGYKDFYKEEWLRNILNWQKDNGCYADYRTWQCTENLKNLNADMNEKEIVDHKQSTRVKRTESRLRRGCLSHKTTVALWALATNIRFLIEKIYGSI